VPPDIQRRLNEAVTKALASEEVQKSLARLGGEPRPSTPEELTSYLTGAKDHWARIIATTHISLE
jgi:tripartite-type tricarboxylate transporter receptor subunit TctC